MGDDGFRRHKGKVKLVSQPKEFKGNMQIGFLLEGETKWKNALGEESFLKELLRSIIGIGNEISYEMDGNFATKFAIVNKAPPIKKADKVPEKKEVSKGGEHIVKISGKDFMTYEGLLKKAHEKGKFSMEITESWVSEDMKRAWCKVRLTYGRQTFDGFGSSTPENNKQMVQDHPIEMAHTRAKGRAFRDFLNIGMVMLEELKDQKEQKKDD